jgi:cell division protein FtsW (lipid II flippase)
MNEVHVSKAMRTNRTIIALGCGVLLAFMLIPLLSYYSCATDSAHCAVVSWTPKILFPVQLFSIIQFALWFAMGADFWPSYIAYVLVVLCLAVFVVKRFHRHRKAKILATYVLVCAILFVVNVALWDIQTSMIFRALPEQPVVQ